MLELRELEAEALGWLPLGDRAYLHVPAKLPLAGSATHEEVPTVTVVGNATDALGLGGVELLVGLKPPRKSDPGGSREFQRTESLREEIQIQ